MKCPKCAGKMVGKKGRTPEGIEYSYSKCQRCGEEILSMEQLQKVAKKYTEMKKYSAKISRWGSSLAMRFPKELTEKYGLERKERVTLIPEKNAIRILA